jgi:hypothetical protein
MNGSQTLVAGGNCTLPGLFQIGQEEAHQIRRYLDHGQSVYGSVQLMGYNSGN